MKIQNNLEGEMPVTIFPPEVYNSSCVQYYKIEISLESDPETKRNGHYYYLTNTILTPEYYIQMAHQLRTAHENDMFFIYINSPGGLLGTGVQIVHAMMDTRARTITIADGEVYSMAALIFMCGQERIVNPYSSFLFHNYSLTLAGKGNEVQSANIVTKQWYETLFKDLTEGFFTKRETQKIFDGKEFSLTADEVVLRLNKMLTIE